MDYIKAKYIFENSRKRKLANNTYLVRGEGYYALTLHGHKIIKWYPNKIILDSCGYQTMTTKARLNEFTQFQIYQKQGIWYITNFSARYNSLDFVFKDNCVYYLKGNWDNLGENPRETIKLRNKIKAYGRKYTKALFLGKVSKPGLGDCFYCGLKDINKKALGEVFRDKNHILDHIRENYFVPSLLVNAIEIFPVSIIAKHNIACLWENAKDKMTMADITVDGFIPIDDGGGIDQIESSIKKYCYRQLGLTS